MASLRQFRLVRAATTVGVVGLLAVLAWYLPRPGYRPSRLYLFVALGGFAVVGGVGARLERPNVAAVGGVGLVLLGFWQAVLAVFVLPVAALLLATAFTLHDQQ